MEYENFSFGVLTVDPQNGHRVRTCSTPLRALITAVPDVEVTQLLMDFNTGTIPYMRCDRLLERSFYLRCADGSIHDIPGCLAIEQDKTGYIDHYVIVLDIAGISMSEASATYKQGHRNLPDLL